MNRPTRLVDRVITNSVLTAGVLAGMWVAAGPVQPVHPAPFTVIANAPVTTR